MIRTITRPSTARCTLPMCIGFLLGEPKCSSCSRLAGVMGIPRDSANRFLQRERHEGKDLYNESAPLLILEGGTSGVDGSVPGKHHRPMKGINLVTLYYTDTNGQHPPVNFRDMLEEVLAWSLLSYP